MGAFDHNSAGGSPSDPCPTGGGAVAYCDRDDCGAWVEQVARFWSDVLRPTYEAWVQEVGDRGGAEGGREVKFHDELVRFRDAYYALPSPSFFLFGRNRQCADSSWRLLQQGEKLLAEIVADLQRIGAGHRAPPKPATPPHVVPTTGWQKMLVPAAVVAGGALVVGGVVYLLVPRRR